MIGTIASLAFERKNEVEDRAALLRSGVLAFARVGLRKSADDLEQLSQVTAEDLLPLLGQQDAYEAGLWVDILRSRVRAIDQLRGLTKADEKEKALQKHLFDHLWLLDPAWERATASPAMEEDLRELAPDLFARDAEGQEIHGRIDIRYATLSGRHVIVELKRYSVAVDARKLEEQGLKYFNALASILRQQGREDEVQRIEVFFVLGKQPGTAGQGALGDEEYYRSVFAPIRGRFALYDQLIANARNQYQDYLDASQEAKALDELLGTLDVEAAAEDE